MSDNPEDIVDDYSEVMADGDFHIEYKRGNNSGRHLSPAELRDLLDLKLKQEMITDRRVNGLFKRIAD